MKKQCQQCNKVVLKPYNRSVKDWNLRFKFCSKECKYRAWIGRPAWNKGTVGVIKPNKTSFKKGMETWNKGLKGYMENEENSNWKGDKVSYGGLHRWVQRHLGKPCVCEFCHKTVQGRGIHWANISGEYLRELTDWLRLCAKCHKGYDKELV